MGSRENYLYLIDVSASMGQGRDFGGRHITKLERAVSYVETKLSQFIQRNLKTLKFGVTLIGSSKTQNILAEAGKAGYDGIRDWIPIETADTSMAHQLKRIKPSTKQCDLLSAIIAGSSILQDEVGTKKQTKNLVLLTDGESPTEWAEDHVEGMISKMNEFGVELTVIGVDFDDEAMGYVEANKSDTKAYNEAELNRIVDHLDSSLIGNLERALKVATGPQVRTVNSRETKTTLTLGDLEAYPNHSLSIAVAFKKASTRAPVTTASKLSTLNLKPGRTPPNMVDPTSKGKIRIDPSTYGLAANRLQRRLEEVFSEYQTTSAERATEDDSMDTEPDEPSGHTHEVSRNFMRFYVPEEAPDKTNNETSRDLERALANQRKRNANVPTSQLEKEDAGPPIELVDMDKPLEKAYLYGGTRVPVGDLDEVKFEVALEPGIQIMGSMHLKDVHREWILNDIGYVYADTRSPKDQVAFSAIVMALIEKEFALTVRYVASSTYRALKLGLLLPRISEDGGMQYCVFVQMPFSEDIRKYSFPSLTLLRNRKGRDVSQHASLPTDVQNEAMAKFVDAMDLDDAAVDEDNKPIPWFNISASYNPAIHNVNSAIAHRYAHPDDDRLPPPHPETTKYLVTPEITLERAKKPLQVLKDVMNVKAVPVKIATGRSNKKDLQAADGDQGDIDFDDFLGGGEGEEFAAPTPPPAPKSSGNKRTREDSETESEEDDEPDPKAVKQESQLPKGSYIDPQKDDPIAKFTSLTQPPTSMTTEARTSTQYAFAQPPNKLIGSQKELGGRKWDDAIKCLQHVRPFAAKFEEAEQFNDFMRVLKEECEDNDGGSLTKFWNDRILKAGVGLITKGESPGEPDVSPEEAARFSQPV